jgi:retinol dehydrogenase-13
MSLSKKTIQWLKKHAPVSMEGKTVLVTGANSGIGFKETELMLYMGARVIMACRNLQKAEKARETLLQEYPNASITLMQLDMADFASIDRFVEAFIQEKTDVDFFVNNAGVFYQPNQKTKNGLELVIGTNYFGVYYLTEKLIPYLQSLPHEVGYVNTVSIIHKIAKIKYGDFYYEKKYKNFGAYARSKLCLARYTHALANRQKDTNLRVFMIHPGIAMTPLGLNAFGGKVKGAANFARGLFNTPEKSALALAHLMNGQTKTGSLIGPRALFGGWGYPKKNRILRKVKVGSDELINFTNKEINRIQLRDNATK